MQIRRLAPVALAGALVLTPTLAACGGSTEAAPAPTTSASQPAAPVRVGVAEWIPVAQSPGTVIIMMGSEPLAQDWYGIVRPEWVTDPLADTKFGGQIAWGISEIPMLFMILTVAWQWSRSDDREAARKDRQADRDGDAELTAYNERLAALDERSRRGT